MPICKAKQPGKRVAVLLAEDNTLLRAEFRRRLDLEPGLEVVGAAKDGSQAVALAIKLRPDVVQMGISMARLNGLKATRRILQALPRTRVLLISAHSDEAYIVAAFQAGARGYLLKASDLENLVVALREIHQGNTYFSPGIPKRLHKMAR